MDNFWNENTAIEFADFMKTFIYPSAYEAGIKAFKESKQRKPEWEILSYCINYLGVNNEIFYKIGNNTFKTVHSQHDDILSEKVLNHNKAIIHSVKRLSDGEVFTIGDKVRYNKEKCSYDNFIINNFFVRFDNKMLGRSESNLICEFIEDLDKVPQPKPFPRFTAEEIIALKELVQSKLKP